MQKAFLLCFFFPPEAEGPVHPAACAVEDRVFWLSVFRLHTFVPAAKGPSGFYIRWATDGTPAAETNVRVILSTMALTDARVYIRSFLPGVVPARTR